VWLSSCQRKEVSRTAIIGKESHYFRTRTDNGWADPTADAVIGQDLWIEVDSKFRDLHISNCRWQVNFSQWPLTRCGLFTFWVDCRIQSKILFYKSCNVMSGVLRIVLRLRRCVRPQCTLIVFCTTLTVLLLRQLYRRQMTVTASAGQTLVATSHGSRVSSAAALRVTGLDDIFISVKTTGGNHDRRITLLQRTWLALAQNQVRIQGC